MIENKSKKKDNSDIMTKEMDKYINLFDLILCIVERIEPKDCNRERKTFEKRQKNK